MSRGRSATTTKVFVGSLPPGVTPEDLRRLFEPYGSIAECDISNRCGFLHLEDHDLAMKAISDLNGTDFMGGRISVEKGRVKPRRGGGGPIRGGKDRGGPYSRGDFHSAPQRNGSFGGRDYPPFGGGDRFGYERPQRGGYDSGYGGSGLQGDRRATFNSRRGGFSDRTFNEAYGDRRSYGDRSFQEGPRGGGFDDRRGGGYDERRPLNDQRPLIGDREGPRGPGSFDRGAVAGDLFSRRDQGPKSGYGGGSNGYGTGGYGSSGSTSAGYGSSTSAGGYGGNGGYGGSDTSGGYNDNRVYGENDGGSYAGPATFGDSYSSGSVGGRAYDTAYPPLPQQRSYASGGGPGPRRDMAPGRRF